MGLATSTYDVVGLCGEGRLSAFLLHLVPPALIVPHLITETHRALVPLGCLFAHSPTITFSIILQWEMNTAWRKLHGNSWVRSKLITYFFETGCCQSHFIDEEPKVQRGSVTLPSSSRYVVAEPGLGPRVLSWDEIKVTPSLHSFPGCIQEMYTFPVHFSFPKEKWAGGSTLIGALMERELSCNTGSAPFGQGAFPQSSVN